MKPFQIIKKAEEMDISVMAALAMRKRYLLGVFDEWSDYIAGKTNIIPLVTPGHAIEEIVSIRKAETNRKKPKQGGITDEMIQSAREYPIDQIIEFTRGVSTAFCHADKTPSLSWDRKRNRAHCFPCGKDYSALDVLIERDGVSFIDAVRQLAGA